MTNRERHEAHMNFLRRLLHAGEVLVVRETTPARGGMRHLDACRLVREGTARWVVLGEKIRLSDNADGWYRYVPFELIDDYVRLGWVPDPDGLTGTPHEHHRLYMWTRCCCRDGAPPPEPKNGGGAFLRLVDPAD